MHVMSQRKDRIFLTGFMGSGKSTIGPILANTIGYDFVDLDRAVEEKEGKTITEIFNGPGEAYFRRCESELVASLSTRSRTVIALGGGTLTEPATFQAIRKSGIMVYLKISPDRLVSRLNHRNDRPMLTDAQGDRLNDADLHNRILQLYHSREPLYAQADFVVLTDEKRVGLTVDTIVKLLGELLR